MEYNKEIVDEKINSDSKKRISLRISGSSFNKEEGYDLRTVAKTLDEFAKIIEKAYLVSINEPSLTKENKTNLQIKLMTVEDGSFLGGIDIGIIGTAITLFQSTNVRTIIEITKEAFNFLKLKNESIKKGERMTINNTGNGSVTVITGGENAQVYNIQSIELAKRAKNNFASVANIPSEDGEVESITIEDEERESRIIFDKSTKDNFKISSSYEENTVSLIGRIISANESTGRGRIRIDDCDVMDGGEYPFEIIDRELYSPILSTKSFKENQKFTALRKIKYDPSTDNVEVEYLKLIS